MGYGRVPVNAIQNLVETPSEVTDPSFLIPLPLASEGYTFNHVTTVLTNDILAYMWDLIDTIDETQQL